MNSKIVFFTLLSSLLAQEAGKLPESSVKCMKEKNCGTDLNCIPACFPGLTITPQSAQKAVDCMISNCQKDKTDEAKYLACAGGCYSTISQGTGKEDNKDNKEDNKDEKKEDSKDNNEEKKEEKKEDNKENKEENKEDNKEKKEDNKEKKEESKDKKEEQPKMPENANKGNNASTLAGSTAFALVLSTISMAL